MTADERKWESPVGDQPSMKLLGGSLSFTSGRNVAGARFIAVLIVTNVRWSSSAVSGSSGFAAAVAALAEAAE